VEDLILRAFETIFSSTNNNGFYDESFGIYPMLEYTVKDNSITYLTSKRKYWRYNPFLMMGIMYTRLHIQNDEIKSHDGKIKKQLNILIEKLTNRDIKSLSSYTVGPLMVSFALAHEIYGDKKYIDAIDLILNNTCFKIKIDEDAFLLLGLSYVYEHISKYREDTIEKIKVFTYEILKHQKDNALFVFRNITSKRHQSQMYTLWALNRAFKILNIENTEPIRKNIEYTIVKRMEEYGGIIWEDNVRFCSKIYHILKNTRYWTYYFECHQCFFAHTVFEYSRLFSDKRYNDRAKKALEWIFGNNRFNLDLLKLSGLNVPHRIVDVNGNAHVKGQKFKGAYEIGGYLMALTDYMLIDFF